MLKTICTVLLTIFISVGFCQPDTLWTVAVGSNIGDKCHSVSLTSDGCFLLGGESYSAHNKNELAAAKINLQGEEVWFRKYGGIYQDHGRDAFELSDGNYITVGYSKSLGEVRGIYHGWVVKISPESDSLWARSYLSDTPCKFYDGVPTEDGGFVAGGENGPFIWLMKADSIGEVQWERFLEIGESSFFERLDRTSDGGFILTGNGVFENRQYDCYLAKTDSAGNMEWLRFYGTESNDVSRAVIQTSDDGYLIAGATNRAENRRWDFYAVRTDSLGEVIWERVYERNRDDVCESVVETPDHGFVLAGQCRVNWNDYLLIRIDSSGETLWTTEYGINDPFVSYETLGEILLLDDGGYALAGYSNTLRGGDDGSNRFWLVRTEPDPVSVPYLLDPAYPDQYALHTPWPNPFNSTVNLSFDLPRPSRVRISIIDDLGRELETISEGWYPTGSHHAAWRAENVPAGMYVARLQTGEGSFFRRMLLVK